MNKLFISVAAASLFATAASAAPINPNAIGGASEATPVEQVRLICNEYGQCWRQRRPRYVQRGYDDGYSRRGYGGGQQYYGGGQQYYGGGQQYYGGGSPSIGFSFGNRGW